MPVVAGDAETRRQILIYTAVLAPLGTAPTLIGMASLYFGVIAAVLGLVYIILAVAICKYDGEVYPRRAFTYSLIYLAILFAALIVDRAASLTS